MPVFALLGALAVAMPFLILGLLAWIAPRLSDINDAPCLVCREHACICGE